MAQQSIKLEKKNKRLIQTLFYKRKILFYFFLSKESHVSLILPLLLDFFIVIFIALRLLLNSSEALPLNRARHWVKSGPNHIKNGLRFDVEIKQVSLPSDLHRTIWKRLKTIT